MQLQMQVVFSATAILDLDASLVNMSLLFVPTYYEPSPKASSPTDTKRTLIQDGLWRSAYASGKLQIDTPNYRLNMCWERGLPSGGKLAESHGYGW